MENKTNADRTAMNETEAKDAQDVAQFVQTLIQGVQDKFQQMSDQILNRIDEMGHRIDDLEHNLNELIQQSEANDDNVNTNQMLTSNADQVNK